MASMAYGSETDSVEPVSDTQRWFSYLPFMEVHTHLQAAALRLYPGRKLAVPPRSAQLKHSTKIRTTRDAADTYKFDLAQVWKMHSPSSYTTPYGFRRALTGENQDSPAPELDVRKYPSLEILRFFDSDRHTVVKFRPLMSAEDILRFLLSDFARKGQCDEIFEDNPTNSGPAKPEPASTTPRLLPEARPAVKTEPAEPRDPRSPRSVFGSSCLARMREAEQHFAALADIEEGDARKRRKLSIAVMHSISRTLFDANKLVLDTTLA